MPAIYGLPIFIGDGAEPEEANVLQTEQEHRARVLMGAYERAARAELKIVKWAFNRKAGPAKTRQFKTWVRVAEALDRSGVDFYTYCAWWMAYWLRSKDTRKVRTTTPPIGMLGAVTAIQRFQQKAGADLGHLQSQEDRYWLEDSKQILSDLKRIAPLPFPALVARFWTALPAEFLAVCSAFHDGCTQGEINTRLNVAHYQAARRYYAEFKARGELARLTTSADTLAMEIQNGS